VADNFHILVPMNIDTPLRELGPIDSTALREAILAQDEAAWKEDQSRQETFDVHYDTESIVMVFVDLEGQGGPNHVYL